MKLKQFDKILAMNIQLEDALRDLGNKEIARDGFACQTDNAKSHMIDSESQSTPFLTDTVECQVSCDVIDMEAQTLQHHLVDKDCQTEIVREPLQFTPILSINNGCFLQNDHIKISSVAAFTQTEEVSVELGLEEISGVYLNENIHTLEQLSNEIFTEESPEERIVIE